MIDFKALTRPLSVDEIDFRVQSINKGGYATILAYKDARVDINRLNEVCTPLGWSRSHVNNNHNCIVSLWDADNKQWVSKEDTGTESNTEAAKGLASDSFKRACFNWGIGIELYDYPQISIKLLDNEVNMSGQKPKQTWSLRLKEWVWYSEFEGGKISFLAAKDQKGTIRFQWGMMGSKAAKEASSKFNSLYDNNSEPLVLWGYIEQFRGDDELSQYIYRNFPKGHKTKIAEILKQARNMFFCYKEIFEGDDDSAIEEAKGELSETEIKIIHAGMSARDNG